MHFLGKAEAMGYSWVWLDLDGLSCSVSYAVVIPDHLLNLVILVQPSNTSPGQLSMEFTLSEPSPKVSKPIPNFPRHPDPQRSLLTIGRAAQRMIVTLCGACQQNLASVACVPPPIQGVLLAKRSRECLGAPPAHQGVKDGSAPLPAIKMVKSPAVLTGHILH